MKAADSLVTDIVLQALRMDDTIKRQDITIIQLKKKNTELCSVIEKMKEIIHSISPELSEQFDLIQL